MPHRLGEVCDRRIEAGRNDREHAIVAGEHRGPPVGRGEPVVTACLVDTGRDKGPDLAEPRVDERLVHAVQQHDRRLRQRLGGSERTTEVRVDDDEIDRAPARHVEQVVTH